jgi:hypothetical protein
MKNIVATVIIGFLSLVNGQAPPPTPTRLSKEGEICGGFTKTLYKCGKGLECVNTHGPMIADAPGACHAICKTKRDEWGNCVPKNCEVWYDGCNTCNVNEETGSLGCTKKMCYERQDSAKCETYSTKKPDDTFITCKDFEKHLDKVNDVCCTEGNCKNGLPETCSPECSSIIKVLFKDCSENLQKTGLDKKSGWNDFEGKCNGQHTGGSQKIPANCATWYDGCNTCNVRDGKVYMCTMRMCLRHGEPHCREYHIGNEKQHERGRQCFDGKDNDHDGEADCGDSDCKIYGICRHRGGKETGRLCFDGKDNDHDGKSDCEDPECLKDPRVARQCNRANHERGRQCFDGKDNDHDGKKDCDDPDCKRYGRCRRRGGKETGKLCFDGKDNDHDGKTDCEDRDCLQDPRARWMCRRDGGGKGNDN